MIQEAFIGHYPPTEQEFQSIWKNCFFVFDTNIFLNLYRYSDSSRQQWMQVLATINKRTWIPFQVATEFHSNRLSALSQNIKKYDETIVSLQDIRDKLNNDQQHPFINAKHHAQCDQNLDQIIKLLDESKRELSQQLRSDKIRDWFCKSYSSNLGDEPTDDAFVALCKNSKERYAKSIPPGYKDESKTEPEKYGDAIIWLQCLEFFKNKNVPLILVTDDSKPDWWLSSAGITVSLRPEMCREYHVQCKQRLCGYSPADFLKYAKQHLKPDLDTRAIQEAAQVSELQRSRNLGSQGDMTVFIDYFSRHLSKYENNINSLYMAIKSIPHSAQVMLREDADIPPDLHDFLSFHLSDPGFVRFMRKVSMVSMRNRAKLLRYINDDADRDQMAKTIEIARMLRRWLIGYRQF
jgi:hypothetical protein